MHVSKREQCAGEIANRIGLLRELDADYPYSCIQAAREGKFDILDEPEIERIKRILSLKLFLYSPLRCMHILKILIEKEEIQKPGKILDELRKRGLVDKKMNVTDLKEKYLENLVYFGFLEASGKNKGRKYGISSRFKTLRRQVPPVLLWLIEDEPCFIDQMWNVADEFNQKFGEVEYISKDGKKSEDFDIQKILYSLMSCKASCEDSRRILREMEIQENFYPGISKNRIVLDLIKTAENLGFQEIKEEMVKKASEFLDLIYVDGENQRLLNNDVIKKVIEDADEIMNADVYLPMSFLPKLEGNKFYYHEITDFLVEDVRLGKIGTVKRVNDTNYQPLLEIMNGEVEILVPLIDDFIIEVDRKNKIFKMDIPEGLVELYL